MHSQPFNRKGGSPQREIEIYQEEDCIEHCSPGVVMLPIAIQSTINSNFKVTTITAPPTTTQDTRTAWGDKFNTHNKHQNSIRALYQYIYIYGLSATLRENINTPEAANSDIALWLVHNNIRQKLLQRGRSRI